MLSQRAAGYNNVGRAIANAPASPFNVSLGMIYMLNNKALLISFVS